MKKQSSCLVFYIYVIVVLVIIIIININIVVVFTSLITVVSRLTCFRQLAYFT